VYTSVNAFFANPAQGIGSLAGTLVGGVSTLAPGAVGYLQ